MNNEQKKFMEEYIDYFDGHFSLIDENASDGAYFQMHLDDAGYALKGVEGIFDIKPPKKLTPEMVVDYYFKWKGDKRTNNQEKT